MVASCSASEELSEANRNPESSRTAIASLSNPASCRSQPAEFHQRELPCSLGHPNSVPPSKATTLPQVRTVLHLPTGYPSCLPGDWLEATARHDGGRRRAVSGVLRFVLSGSCSAF